MLAVQRGNADLVGLVLDDGADPNGTTAGWNAPILAALNTALLMIGASETNAA